MPRNILPWVLLAAAIVVALSVMRSPPPKDPTPVASTPPPPAASPSPPASSVRKFDDPPLDEREMRDSRVRIGHEECEQGAMHINELEGRAPTDGHGLHFVGVCLQHGNVAWYRCIVGSTTRDQAATCNRRLLNSGNVP